MVAKVEKKRRSFIVAFVAVVLCACVAISLFSVIKDIRRTKMEIASVNETIAEVDADNAEQKALNDKIENGDKDEYVENEARKLGYVKQGERVYYDSSVND